MSPGYDYVVESAAIDFLAELEPDELRFLLGSFEWLARKPNEPGILSHHDRAGRAVQAHFFGSYTIVAWTDHAVREVRIVEVIED
ncbi:MAG: hypothetical protein WC661_18210 [Opitutaceae bacterium]|jgi:hypothetical protein